MSGRRSFLASLSRVAMVLGLVGGYGTFAGFAVRFLFPARRREKRWMFVAEAETVSPGETLVYRTPAGEPVNITRQGGQGLARDFIALSSTCPHLGCQVHWEPQNNRYFCPCHNGVFTPEGKGIAGPPGDAGQSLFRYPLKVEYRLLFIEVPVTSRLSLFRRGRVVARLQGLQWPPHRPGAMEA